MKKIIPITIVGILILSGLGVVTANDNSFNESLMELNDSDILIAPIINPYMFEFQSFDEDGRNFFQEPIFFTVSYKQHTNQADNIKDKNLEPEVLELRENSQSHNYVIITTEALTNAITTSNFLTWKNLIGYNVKIVEITDPEIANQPGGDLPEKIRNFLRDYYQEWGIEYVLIVGNHETIPMRYCYPDPTNHRFDIFDFTSGEVPTDYYYADLSSSDSSSWDLDGDGFYGEYGQDSPDFFAEVYVGRIPTNTKSRITYALDKTVTFEQDIGAWKQNALHVGAFYYFTNEGNSGNPAMDGAVVSHFIEQDIMSSWTISHYSEQAGLEKSVYNWPALTESAFINDWRTGHYSVVNWQGHGWTNRVARKVWSSDDGDGVPENNEFSWPDFINIYSNLDDDYPSIVTALSCYVGCPEFSPDGNLGIDLLTNPSVGTSIGVIASARSPYGSYSWPYPPGGSESIIYEFNRYMINESNKVGEALYKSKYFCNQNYAWAHYTEYLDLYTFNLFGDPSLEIEGVYYENLPPKKPEKMSGPDSGKPGDKYTFEFVTTDPNSDQVKYVIYWGDGNSFNTDFYDSGASFEIQYSWGDLGDFTITVVAIDEYDLESEPLIMPISMPRNKIYFNYLIQSFLDSFPMLRLLIQRFGFLI